MTSCAADGRRPCGAFFALLLFACAAPASAHEFRIAYLEVRERTPGNYSVSWRAPVQPAQTQAVVLAAHPRCRLEPLREIALERLQVRDYGLDCSAAEDGGWLALRGLEQLPDDALVTVIAADGSERPIHLRGASQQFDLVAHEPVARPRNLFAEGVAHVLGGYDHLLYVVLLFLFLRHDWRQLMLGVTAFTIAHSLTLALAAAGWLRVPVRPVEAVIALTIAYFAIAVMRGRRPQGAAWRWQAVIVACGLVHGLGFANSLSGLGLGREPLLWGLLTFNLGIEAAQLACVGAAYACSRMAHRLATSPVQSITCEWGVALGAGAVGVFWYFERMFT